MDERKQKDREHRFKLAQLDEDDAFREVLATEAGRRLMWRILSHCNFFSTPAIENPHLLMQVGRRDIGVWLFSEMERLNFESIYLMHKEALEREEKLND